VISDIPSNTVGGTTAADRNILSGNTNNGVEITGPPGGTASVFNMVEGNFIGTQADGSTALGNGMNGGRPFRFGRP
jgi:hypothetical protein